MFEEGDRFWTHRRAGAIPRDRRSPYQLRWPGWVAVVVFAAAELCVKWPSVMRTKLPGARVPYMFGHVVGGLLAAFGGSWLAWRLLRGRRLSPSAAMIAVAALLTVSVLADVGAQSGHEIENAIVAAPGPVEPRWQAIMAALKATGEAGTPSLGSYASPEAFGQRIKLLDDAIRETDAFELALIKADRDLDVLLEANEIPEPSRRDIRATTFRTFGGPGRSRNAKSNRRMFLANRQLLAFLQTNWGKWHFDRFTQRLVIDDPALHPEWAQLVRAEREAEAYLAPDPYDAGGSR